MSMKFTLFDADDLKGFEDLLFRAMVRCARVLRKEGLIPDLTLPTAPPATPSFLRGPPEEIAAHKLHTAETVFRQSGNVPDVRPPPAPQRPPEVPTTPETVFGQHIERQTPEEFAADKSRAQTKPTRRSARDVCRTQRDKPEGGWITTEEAAKIMVNGSNLNIERAKTMLGQWILDGTVAGVIVTSVKPPTKMLPGRLHVKKEDVIARDKQRQENAAMMPGPRAMAEKRAKDRLAA